MLPSSVGFSGGSVIKILCANAGDASSIPGSGRNPGEGNGNPLQYSSLGSPIHRGAWQAIVHGVAKELDTTKQQLQALHSKFVHIIIYLD